MPSCSEFGVAAPQGSNPSHRLRRFVLALMVCFGAGLLILLLTIQQAWAGDQPAEPEAPGTISGVVRDEQGAPLAALEVLLYRQQVDFSLILPTPTPVTVNSASSAQDAPWYPVRQTTTDANGSYRIGLLGAGVYRVLVRDPAHVYAQTAYPAAQRIEDATDIPIAGVAVSGIDMQLPLGGLITGVITHTTLAGNSLYIELQLLQQQGEEWQAVRSIVYTNIGYRYRLGALRPGNYRLCAHYYRYYTPAYIAQRECYDNVYAIEDARDLTVGAGATISNVDILLGDGADFGQITGTITAAEDGHPLAEIDIHTYIASPPFEYPNWSLAGVTRTNSVGRYRLRDLPPGRYKLSVFDAKQTYREEVYQDQQQIVQTISIERNQLRDNVNLSLTLTSHITGRVTISGGDISPLVSVQLEPFITTTQNSPRYYIQANSLTGEYRLRGVEPGVYRVYALGYLQGYEYNLAGFYGGATAQSAQPVTLTAGVTTTGINIVLQLDANQSLYAGEISGRATVGGEPASGVQVALFSVLSGLPDTPVVYVFTDASGRYGVGGLNNDLYVVRFSDPQGRYATIYYPDSRSRSRAQIVPAFGGEASSNVNAALQLGGGISGTVRLLDGTPLAGIEVQVYGYFDNYWQLVEMRVRTDPQGGFAMRGLSRGVYQLCFFDPRGRFASECYGAPYPNSQPGSGFDLVVEPGQLIRGVNQILGPDLPLYFPAILAQ